MKMMTVKFPVMLMLLATLATSCGEYAAKGAGEGATVGAASGAVGGLISALVFGGIQWKQQRGALSMVVL